MRFLAAASALALLLAACSSDETSSDTTPDTSPLDDVGTDTQTTPDTDSPDAVEEDILQIGDVPERPDAFEGARCPAESIIDAWPLINTESPGPITASETGGVFTATIDASAGGIQEVANNPFVYLNLQTGEQVEITDFESLQDTTWHIAFKRTMIRINGGDSGPGGLEMGKVSGSTVQSASVADVSVWETDLSFDEDCAPYVDPIGQVIAAINFLNIDNPSGSASWYNYAGGVSPTEGDVYVLRDPASGAAFSWEIVSWSSGVYTLRWQSR